MRTSASCNVGLPHPGLGDGALLVTTHDRFTRLDRKRFVPHIPDRPGLDRIIGYRGRGGPVWEPLGSGKFAAAISTSYRALRIPPHTPVFSVSEDRAGNLWTGSQARLIRLWNGSPRLYTEKDGLPKKIVAVIEEDRGGRVWLNLGTRADPLNLQYQHQSQT